MKPSILDYAVLRRERFSAWRLFLLRLTTPFVAVLTALLLVTYSIEIWSGVTKHTPPCAPITLFASSSVFTLSLVGAFAGAIAIRFTRPLGGMVGMVGSMACVAVAALWVYWLSFGILLPYDEFVSKAGMP